MLGTREQHLQILGLLVAALLVFVVRQVRDHDGASNAMTAIAANCEFAKPGEYRAGPYRTSIKVCTDRMVELPALKNHMRVHCKGMDACVAAEFGSLVAVGLIPSLDLFFINLILAPVSEVSNPEMISCVFERDETRAVHNPVVVSFLDENLTLTSRTFHNRGACLVHAMDAAMRGEP